MSVPNQFANSSGIIPLAQLDANFEYLDEKIPQFSVTAGTVTEASQTNITAIGVLNSLSVTGTVTAGTVTGTQINGVLATASQPNITAIGALTNLTVSNTLTAGSITTTTITGQLTTASQPSITAVGALQNLSVVGNVVSGAITAPTVAAQIITSSQPLITEIGTLNELAVTSQLSAANISATAISATNIAGTLTTANQPNITGVGALNSLSVLGNISAPNVLVTNNVSAVNISTTGLSATTISGTLSTAAQPNITSVGTLSSLGVSGTVTTNTLVSNTMQGTLSTAAQPIITSVGTLTGLLVNGSISVSGGAAISGNLNAQVNGFDIGYRELPQVILVNGQTLAAGDSGKHIYGTSAGTSVLNIPTNAAQNIPVGTVVTVINRGSGSVSLTPGSGVDLYIAGSSVSGTKSLGSYGMAALIKVETNVWFVNGTGLS
jgi:hypothetical protein